MRPCLDLGARRLARKGKCGGKPEKEKIERKLAGLRGQIGLLTERLALMPKDVEPKPIYEQLAKMQRLEVDYGEKLKAAEQVIKDEPIDLKEFEKFAQQMNALLEREEDPLVKTAVIQKIVEKVLVTKTTGPENWGQWFEQLAIWFRQQGLLRALRALALRARLRLAPKGPRGLLVNLTRLNLTTPKTQIPKPPLRGDLGIWFRQQGLNLRPLPCQGSALPLSYA